MEIVLKGHSPLAALMLEVLTSAGLDLSLKAADFGTIVTPDLGAISSIFYVIFRRNFKKTRFFTQLAPTNHARSEIRL